MDMVANDLKFHQRIANTFMGIARWIDKMDSFDSNLLPPDYNTITQSTLLLGLMSRHLNGLSKTARFVRP